jgi:S-adenosyl-L-methionine hydrolase (adenosine-forming)
MPIVTLTSDTNYHDYYIGRLKGKLLCKVADNLNIVDISHQIGRSKLNDAAAVLKNSIFSFPENTIHLVDVATVNSNKLLLFKIENQFLITSDTGIIGLITGHSTPKCKLVELLYEDNFDDIAVEIIKELTTDFNFDKMGQDFEDFKIMVNQVPFIQGDFIKGSVVYIDRYENVITDIHKNIFEELVKDKKFIIRLDPEISQKAKFHEDKNIYFMSTKYSDKVKDGTHAYFNQKGFLELSFTNGNLASLLKLRYRDPIRIEVIEK